MRLSIIADKLLKGQIHYHLLNRTRFSNKEIHLLSQSRKTLSKLLSELIWSVIYFHLIMFSFTAKIKETSKRVGKIACESAISDNLMPLLQKSRLRKDRISIKNELIIIIKQF